MRAVRPMSKYLASLLADLAAGEWVCGATFYASMRPTFAQRFSECNTEARAADGEDRIESEVCHDHAHRGTIHRYRDRWALRPQQLTTGIMLADESSHPIGLLVIRR